MRGLVFGEDHLIALWVYEKHNLVPIPVCKSVGIVDLKTGEMVGAALYQNFTYTNVDLSYYGEGTLSAGIVRSLARIAVDMGVARGTLLTSKRNRRLIRSLLKLGFKLEGTMRCYYGHADTTRNTAVRLVMFTDGLRKLGGLDGLGSSESVQSPRSHAAQREQETTQNSNEAAASPAAEEG